MEPFQAIGVVAALAGIGVVLVRTWNSNRRVSSRASSERLALLKSVAVRRGGKLDRDRGVTFALDGATFEVRLEVSWETNLTVGTKWSVALPAPGTTPFTIVPEGFASVFGGPDVQVGTVPAFDHQFRIKAPIPETFRRLWTRARCEILLAKYRAVTSTGDRLVLEGPAPAGASDVEAGIELLLDLARTDLFGLAALRALPDAVPELDRAHGVRVRGPSDVWIGLRPIAHGFVTQARALIAHEVIGPLELAAASDDNLAPLPAHIRRRARDVGPAELASTGTEITITWPTIEEDRARLVAAIEVLRGFAQGSTGVFR